MRAKIQLRTKTVQISLTFLVKLELHIPLESSFQSLSPRVLLVANALIYKPEISNQSR